MLYPYLLKTGSAIIHLDPATLGLPNTSKTQILKNVANIKENNKTTETNSSAAAKQ